MDINNYIDLSVINNTHFDISQIVHIILKDNYRYINNNNWEYLDKNNKWVCDKKHNNLIYSIKTEVYTHFIKRSIEWNNLNNNIMSTKILLIASKLKENKYISAIIKEAQQFFI